jgi:hypothetical protein
MSERPPMVLITGCARSGTSMVAGVLAASGLDFGGPLVKATAHNPKGFFEHRVVRQKIVKPLLRSIGADQRGQNPLPPRHISPCKRDVAVLRARVLHELGGARAYKDAKVLLLWRYFRAAFPDAVWVLVRREPKAIARSCLRTPFMRGYGYMAGWLRWVQEHEVRMDDLRASGARVLEIWPDPHEPEGFRPIVEELGLVWNEERVRAALVPGSWSMK